MKVTSTPSPLAPDFTSPGQKPGQPGFKDSLIDSIKKVNDLQSKAHQAMEDLSTGRNYNLHEAMIAIAEKRLDKIGLARVFRQHLSYIGYGRLRPKSLVYFNTNLPFPSRNLSSKP